MADKIPDISPNVDETMKELETHGSFELPVETYTDNCEIFRSLYNHWHKEMEIICIDKGNGLARLNRETLRLKEGDLLIVNSGVLHGIKSDSRHILYYRSVVFDLSFLAGPAGDLCQEKEISLLARNYLPDLSEEMTAKQISDDYLHSSVADRWHATDGF